MSDRFKFRAFGGRNKELIKVMAPEAWVIDGYIVMQSTSLRDKNGKLIFEGDIVKSINYNIIHENGGIDREASEKWSGDTTGVVEYFTYNAQFMVALRGRNDVKVDQWNNTYELQPSTTDDYEVEIIGNIYENSDLLEGDEIDE